ncbi:DUF4876 domain-containing protein [Sphingobacterium humi]|uniref:DUF4876 domain-containing protein n=1 Tax=Sphingobacterium humi TaxID=1796905 RepID=A0A6N8L3L6_9SPHI|nr:DUF4876 domain-containing protein [Sphingobacterium humi]MVZ63674.1 DUF4876 domain-containing protein [Sphingobacterium humi]
MKYSILLIAILLVVISSCRKDTELTKALKLTVAATIKSEENLKISSEGTIFKITNKTNGSSYQAVVQADGKAVFESITPGSYTITASHSISAEKYTELAGYYVEDAVNFSGSADKVEVFEDKTVAIDLVAGKTGNLVFKQIYYAGSNVSTGAVFRDVFLEIYNNSNQVIYADSLYFGQVIGNNNTKPNEYNLENGQFDWSKSIGMTVEAGKDANLDYIYAHTLFRIPSDGSGKQHPIQPGQSIIIAANAVDHTNSYESNSTDPVTITNPELTVNLSRADFEVNLIEFFRPTDNSAYTPYRFDVDNINVPNVDVLHNSRGKDLILNALGRDAYFIADTRGTNIKLEDLKNYPSPQIRQVIASTDFYKQLPTSVIVDAVELQHPVASNRVPKRLPNNLDAGRTFVPGGQYSSQSLVRKTLKTVNGRRILKDTNNSEADFGHLQKADVSKSASSFID